MNEILLKSPTGEEPNFNGVNGATGNGPTAQLFYAMSEKKIVYDARKPFFNMLSDVSGTKDPCAEGEARAIYCGQLWLELGILIREKAKELKELAQAEKDRFICYDAFFDGLVDTAKPVYFAIGRVGEVDMWERDEVKDAKLYWYCAQKDAAALVHKELESRLDPKNLRVLIAALEADKAVTIPLGNNLEVVGGPCFRDRIHTKRFSGNGDPDKVAA